MDNELHIRPNWLNRRYVCCTLTLTYIFTNKFMAFLSKRTGFLTAVHIVSWFILNEILSCILLSIGHFDHKLVTRNLLELYCPIVLTRKTAKTENDIRKIAQIQLYYVRTFYSHKVL